MTRTSPPQPDYRLADHVRACCVDGQVILLDLQRNRYIGVVGPLVPAISRRIADWPLTAQNLGGPSSDPDTSGWIDNMLRAGLITTASCSPPLRDSIDEPLQSLGPPDAAHWAGVRWRRMASITCATIIARRWLKRRSLADIAGRVRRLRQGSIRSAITPTEDLRGAVDWYLRMRPFTITSHDECVHDSLTLLRFLAAERFYPRWVIGVRTRPFGAHSWVQEGSLVLNDVHETVRGYTPILVV